MKKISSLHVIPSDSPSTSLPEIIVTDRAVPDVAEEAWEAVLSRQVGVLFRQGEVLVRLAWENGTPTIRTVDRRWLTSVLVRAAQWVTILKTGVKLH